MGLVCFGAGAITYLTHGWDPTSFFCTAGYLLCGLGMALPQGTCFSSPDDREDPDVHLHEDAKVTRAHNAVLRGVGLFLNVVGLLLGIVGSLMYSPTVNNFLFHSKADTWGEFEWLRHIANMLWAVSFFLFPVGVGLFLFDRWSVMYAHNAAVGKAPPSLWNRNLRVLVWSELMLCIFAVGGVFFCFEHDENAAVTSWILFFCGGCIKVGLLFAELLDMVLGTNCAGGRGAGVDICGGTVDGGDDAVSDANHTAALLGDPGSGGDPEEQAE